MVGKQLEILISDVKKGGAKKSYICYVDEKKGNSLSLSLAVSINLMAKEELKS